ncbi:MAG: hypothetical protein J6M44_17415 [Butyrivibrio sp.]|uniref:hypothetical protein n=1 Tax=Butyrivibrio sp. TaxID=28121 RepID=UPI001B6C906D|nr:hypothetical protein [Butyrivibrio sp.]MBP3280728.1 hypothetical protein [Butyrivibrio sp.]MBP3782103.1 hypothetical protein [Butyrivibrio sp.]
MAAKIRASKAERNEAKEYIKAHLPQYLEREGINPERNFKCLNPNHDDTHGDMSYHRPSNSCACHCGARYDTFDLIGIEYGLTDFNEKFKKGCEIFGLLGQEENDEDLKIPANWREINPPDEYKLPERAEDELCSKVYYRLTKLKCTKLKEEHKKDLLRRGLSEEDIKRFRFCSVPDSGKEAAGEIVSSGIFPAKVPGFYTYGHYSIYTMVDDTKGYYCPAFDGETNQIAGMQIRADNPQKGGKYIWLSSSRKHDGASSGALPTILPGKDTSLWIVTEGILKALIIYCLLGKEVSVIGVPGVGTIGGFKEFMKKKAGLNICFVEAYDMDKVDENKVVKQAQQNLLREIEKNGFKAHTLTWDTKNGQWQKNYKGLDDFLCDYVKTKSGREKFITYLKKIKASLLQPQTKTA